MKAKIIKVNELQDPEVDIVLIDIGVVCRRQAIFITSTGSNRIDRKNAQILQEEIMNSRERFLE